MTHQPMADFLRNFTDMDPIDPILPHKPTEGDRHNNGWWNEYKYDNQYWEDYEAANRRKGAPFL